MRHKNSYSSIYYHSYSVTAYQRITLLLVLAKVYPSYRAYLTSSQLLIHKHLGFYFRLEIINQRLILQADLFFVVGFKLRPTVALCCGRITWESRKIRSNLGPFSKEITLVPTKTMRQIKLKRKFGENYKFFLNTLCWEMMWPCITLIKIFLPFLGMKFAVFLFPWNESLI